MKRIINALLAIIVLSLAQSCSIEKRKYLPGYSINLENKAHKSSLERKVLVNGANDNTYKEEKAIGLADNNTTTAILDQELIVKRNPTNELVKNGKNQICDVILLLDGEEIKGKIMEVTQTELRFKRCDNPKGPLLSIRKSEVFMVTYANGTKDVFTNLEEKKQKHIPEAQGGKKNNSMATVSFIFACLSVAIFPFFLVGLILGLIALNQIKKSPDLYKNKWMAIVAVVLGLLPLLLILVLVILILSIIR